MRLAGIQFNIAWEDKSRNFEKVRSLLDAAQPKPNTLVVLPEMFATGFSMNTDVVAEGRGGITEVFLKSTATDYRIWLLAGVVMRGTDGKPRNNAVVFSPVGKMQALYSKNKLFTPGGEAEHYSPGRRTTVLRCNGCSIGLFICYDLRFPELFRRAVLVARPELFVIIASWPAERLNHWIRLLQARAIENQSYIVGVNRVGTDPFHAYRGHSMLVDPQGEIVAEAGEQEGCIRGELDLDALRQYRRALPFLNELRQ